MAVAKAWMTRSGDRANESLILTHCLQGQLQARHQGHCVRQRGSGQPLGARRGSAAVGG